MKYMGSKNRLSKHILPIMLKYRTNQTWVEPFVGGGNMIDKVTGPRIGADIDPYTISSLISIRDFVNELPKNDAEFTEADYYQLRDKDSKHKGYIGYALSFGGQWMAGWRRGLANNGSKRDYVREAYSSAVRQSKLLQGVELVCCSYDNLKIPGNSIIYCDPPYKGTTSYKNKFDSDKFWDWCRVISNKNIIFISEYNAPPDFKCIYEHEVCSSLTPNRGAKKAIEKLYTIDL
jgi:DNA adenine methylase